jgi:hypothetical protein
MKQIIKLCAVHSDRRDPSEIVRCAEGSSMYRDEGRRTFTLLSLEIPSALRTPEFHQGAAGARAGAACGVWPRFKEN